MNLSFDINSLVELGGLARQHAQENYIQTETGMFLPSGYAQNTDPDFPDFEEAITKNVPQLSRIDIAARAQRKLLPQLEEKINAAGLQHVDFLASGSTSVALFASGHHDNALYAVRVGIGPRYNVGTEGQDRSECCHVAPSYITLQQDDFFELKITPLLYTYDFGGYSSVLEKFIIQLYQDTCFKESDVWKDHALLPDGTFLWIDPGAITYTEGFYSLTEDEQEAEIGRSNQLVQDRIKEWDIPDFMNPLDRDGAHKIYKFFPNNLTKEPTPEFDEPSI
jgi:hypothetical protein